MLISSYPDAVNSDLINIKNWSPCEYLSSFHPNQMKYISEDTQEIVVTKQSLPEAPKEGEMRNKQ